jgi:GNAT superfamily N-acetyltransferase
LERPLENNVISPNTWVRYDWDLGLLPRLVGPPEGYELDTASEADRKTVFETVIAAYGSDPVWRPHLDAIEARMGPRIAETIGDLNARYLVVRHASLCVAVSGIAREHWTDQNLLTGICVLSTHQRRGVGRALLLASLHALCALGCAHARVYTEADSLADRKVYPLFGGVRTLNVRYPGDATTVSAPR